MIPSLVPLLLFPSLVLLLERWLSTIVADNRRRPAQSGVERATPSSSEASTHRDSANLQGVSTFETPRHKRNRPRSRNRAAYGRHHPVPHVVREISPIAEDGSLTATLPEGVQTASGSAVPALTPIIDSGAIQGPTSLKHQWLARLPSST